MAGDDVLKGGDGKDTLDGGDGANDIADFSDRTASVVLTLNGAHAIDVTIGGVVEDQLLNIEDIIGSNSSDALTGDSHDNRFRGLGGHDVIDGKGGTLDVADYSDKTSAISVHLNTSIGADVLVGGHKEDRLLNIEGVVGTGRADTLTGDSKDNLFRGMAGKDAIDGGAGAHDTADYDDKQVGITVTLNGASKVTVRVGGQIEDTLKDIENVNGGSGGDKLTGDSRANLLQGIAGDDTVSGGAGNDTVSGGWGKDSLIGGAGNDRFQFTSSTDHAGVDTIKDFVHAQDKIALDNDVWFALGDKTGTLKGDMFYAHSGATHGHDSSDRIVYDTHTGKLYYDANGSASGGVTQIAVLSNHAHLSASDFVVV